MTTTDAQLELARSTHSYREMLDYGKEMGAHEEHGRVIRFLRDCESNGGMGLSEALDCLRRNEHAHR